MLPEVEAALSGLRPRATTVPMYSTVTGARIGGEALDARYWCRNLREPVRMDLALDALSADGFGVFTEISAHPLLAIPLTAFTADRGGVVLGSLRRDHGGLDQIVRGLGELHVHGHPVDWTRVIDGPGRLVGLPGYAFQRQSYWIDGGSRTRQERQAPPRTWRPGWRHCPSRPVPPPCWRPCRRSSAASSDSANPCPWTSGSRSAGWIR